jgi:hypothetical protein
VPDSGLPPAPAPAVPGTVPAAEIPGDDAPTADALARARTQACTLTGGPGRDILISRGSRANVICGRGGDDIIRSGAGDDVIRGGAGADRLFGGPGADILISGRGRDRLFGGGGRDSFLTLDGGQRDVVRGGAGEDAAVNLDRRDRLLSIETRPTTGATARASAAINTWGGVWCSPGHVQVNGPSLFADGSPNPDGDYVVARAFLYYWNPGIGGWSYLTETPWIGWTSVPGRYWAYQHFLGSATSVQTAWNVTRGHAYAATVQWYAHYAATYGYQTSNFDYTTFGFPYGTSTDTDGYCQQ